MIRLPTGTVTLLLADIEGSTSLWESDPAAMTDAVRRLDAVVADVVARHSGARPVEQGEGDSFVIAFARASDAVACALDLQRAALSPIRLRVGLHTGEVQLRDEGNYVGPAINRCARLRDLGHGGQTLLSQSTHDLVVDRLPDDAWLTELGAHRMRDLDRPERIYQLSHADVQVDFPRLRSLDAFPHNLPVQLTSFIGRESELAELRTLALDSRLVTLTGAGGAGKTRLALQLAAELLSDFPDGVWHIDLAPISDTELVPTVTARTLGFHDEVGRTPTQTLTRHLADKRVLIVLDNCEHLISACAELADRLLTTCPALLIVATSREPVGVSGEVAYRVPSLCLSRNAGQECEAVVLFADRARRARPSFEVTDENRSSVIEICERLDGLPLALELAAARLRAFSPEQIADGLHDRFRLLTGGARTAVPRQQTLRASVDWSYHLLTEPERLVFERLSVFAGSFDLDAALAVGVGDGLEPHHVLDLVALLVDKSLLHVEERRAVTRYRMLETVRQYALDHLTESNHAIDVRRRHRDHFLQSALRIPLFRIDEEEGDRTVLDLDNFRAAIRWSLDADDHLEAAQLITALLPVWVNRSISEGRGWYDVTLEHREQLHPAIRSWALGGAAFLDIWAEEPIAIARAEECVDLARELNHPPGFALALSTLVNARMYIEGVPDWDTLAECVAVARDAGDRSVLAHVIDTAATVDMNFGDPSRAVALAQECVDLWEQLGATGFLRGAKTMLACALLGRGDPVSAGRVMEGVVEGARARKSNLALAVSALGWTQALSGDHEAAIGACDEALALAADAGSSLIVSWVGFMRGIALLAAGDAESARDQLEVRFGSPVCVEWSTAHLAEALAAMGDIAAARETADRILETLRPRGTTGAIGIVLLARARVAIAEGDDRTAEELAHESLQVRQQTGELAGLADALEVLSKLVPSEVAPRLLGAASSIRDLSGARRFKVYEHEHASLVARLHSTLGDDAFDAAWAEGAAMSLDEAVAYVQRGRGERKRPATGWASLTPTELDVVRLVADGLANKEIATKLFISPRTVQAHLTHVYAKLGISSRVQLAREAAERA